MRRTTSRICLCLAVICAVALADLADVLGPETCPSAGALNDSSSPDCQSAKAGHPTPTPAAAAESSLTSTAVAGVVFVQLAVTVLVTILFQRHMKPKDE